jgi:chemotaxis response regulator CheB
MLPIYMSVDERLLICATLRLAIADELLGSDDNDLVLHAEREGDEARNQISEFKPLVDVIALAGKLAV